MQELSVLPDLTLLHVVSFRIAETRVEVLPEVLERRVLPPLELRLDVVEGDGPLDQGVVVGVLPLRGQPHELERRDLPAAFATHGGERAASGAGGAAAIAAGGGGR